MDYSTEGPLRLCVEVMTPTPPHSTRTGASLPPLTGADRLSVENALDRLDRLFSVRLASHWIRQRAPGGKWYRPGTAFGLRDLRSVLAGRAWIGFGARRDGRTRWVNIDVDLPGKERIPSSITERDRIAALVLGTLKPASPLIVETPSGGLRIVIAVPECDIADVLDWDEGFISCALRAAGLAVGHDKEVELYPHCHRGERLLVGANMPELDPETLERIEVSPLAADAHAFAESIERRLRRLEELAAAPDAALLARMRSMAVNLRSACVIAPGPAIFRTDDGVQLGSAPCTTTDGELLTQGLSRPNSRYGSEWLVAKILVRDPTAPTRYGSPPHDGTVAGIARALAEWLSFAANGVSKEWRASLSANGGDVDRAIASWQHRYMAGVELEDSLIHRARRAAAASGPVDRESLAWCGASIAEDAWRVIHAASVSSQLDGAGRFRFGVWSICLLTAASSIARHHLSRGRTVSLMSDGRHWLRVPICTRWMANWPGGGGIRGDLGERSYKQYLRTAVERGLAHPYALAPATKAVRVALAVNGDTDSLPADEYLVMPLAESALRRYSMSELVAVARAMPCRNSRPFHPMEVQHLLFLQDAGVRWDREFGRATGCRLHHQAERARRELECVHEGQRDTRPAEAEMHSVDGSMIEPAGGAVRAEAA